MIKEFFRKLYGYDFLKECIDDLRKDVAELWAATYTNVGDNRRVKVKELAETCKKADATNEDAIRFLLRAIDIDESVFESYKYFKFTEIPWYIQELFTSKYRLTISYDFRDMSSYIYYKGELIGGKDSSHVGELLDNINKIDKRTSKSKGKK